MREPQFGESHVTAEGGLRRRSAAGVSRLLAAVALLLAVISSGCNPFAEKGAADKVIDTYFGDLKQGDHYGALSAFQDASSERDRLGRAADQLGRPQDWKQTTWRAFSGTGGTTFTAE